MDNVASQSQPDKSAVYYSLLGGEHAQRGRRLYTTGLILLVTLLGYLAYHARVDNQLHLFQGLLIVTLSIVPSLQWAKTGGSRFPVFETIMLMCANAYGMPLLDAHEQLVSYSDEVLSRAGWTVVLYLVTAMLVYRLTTGMPGRSRFWLDSLISNKAERKFVFGLLFSALYVAISTFTTLIPPDYNSVLRAVFFGLGILSTFVCAQRWGRGDMTQGEKLLMICTLLPQLIMMSVGLVLVGAISLIGIGLLGYLSGGKRIPWVVLTVAFTLIAVLHTGKTRMRAKYWDPNDPAPAPTITELPAFFTEWIDHGLQPTSGDKSVGHKIIERTSLMHILCLIIDCSPQRQDYLYGSTYRHVLPQLIPRFFWPEKPRSHIATYELGIYYGLQREEDTTVTTIAFGLLTEVYANFGLFGPLLLGIFWGYGLKKLQLWSTFSPMFSFAGLFMVLLTAWSFSAELTMAAWVSSFQQAVVVVLGIPFIIRSLLRD